MRKNNYFILLFLVKSQDINQINNEPIKLPITHKIIDISIVLATPKVIIFAIQCWKPQKINNGIPYIIPNVLPFLYIKTAIYIITPHKQDLRKNAKEKSHVFTFKIALFNISVSIVEYNKPNK